MSDPPREATALVIHGERDALSALLLSGLPETGGHVRWKPSHADRLPTGPSEADPDAAVYLAAARGDRGLPDLEDAEAWLRSLAKAAIPHVVLLSSTQVIAPSERHPGLVTERHYVPGRRSHEVADRWRRLEKLARRTLSGTTSALTILRSPPPPVRGGDDYFSRLFAGRFAVTVAGHDPPLQLLSVGDLSAAIARAVTSGVSGLFHLAPSGAVSLRNALRASGVRRLPVPYTLASGLGRLRGRAGGGSPLSQLDYLRYSWTVSGDAAREALDFTPTHGSHEALRRLRPRRDLPDAEPDDPFGMDREYIGARCRGLFRFLHDRYWRVELAGTRHVPSSGPVVLVGNHRGFFPWDGMMMLHTMVRDHDRYPRFLVHPGLLKFPYVFDLMRKLGGIPACRENADWVLRRGGTLGVFPEGVRGAFSLYSDAHRLGSFGRPEFVRAARQQGATIVPFVTVGSAETLPIIAKVESRWWRRHALWPCIPVTPTLLPVPLPAKWHTRFLDPVLPAELDASSADEISDRIRHRMQEALDGIVAARPSVFRGNVFD